MFEFVSGFTIGIVACIVIEIVIPKDSILV